MTRLCRSLVLAACAVGLLTFAPAAMAGHAQDPRTPNLEPKGHIFEPAVTGGFGGANPNIHTDKRRHQRSLVAPLDEDEAPAGVPSATSSLLHPTIATARRVAGPAAAALSHRGKSSGALSSCLSRVSGRG